MRLCDETITVYNSYVDPTTRFNVYIPTVIRGVSWFGSLKAKATEHGLVSANEYSLRIPFSSDFGGKQFLPPKEYQALEDKSGYFTLAKGDTIVRGDHSEIGTKPAKLSEKYDDVITVVSVTGNGRTPFAQHWRVIGK